ncbi:RNA-directed DNA polymerase [Elizabethkingia anophelis]|nr:RNA-directed DNA polymerase [Elizabethkingia anophelis]MCT4262376.1 RNA-directed DNA polymerase [Elizabethkingia anophelis]
MKDSILQNWENYFRSKGLSDNIIDEHLKYIQKLNNNKLPIIFEFIHLARLLGRSRYFLALAVNNPESLYREFEIPKRNSKELRTITCPYPSLLGVQDWIYNNILKTIKVHPCAHGFLPNKSIVSNVKPHIASRQILKMDLKNFFPSININRVISIFYNQGYNKNISYYLARLCTFEDVLPQGAPTSPALSNIVCYKMDKRIYRLCRKFNLNYTRYADDLTISGANIPKKIFNYIKEVVEDSGFELKDSKTRFYNQNSKKIITGVQIKNNEITLPKSYKKSLCKELYYIKKYGLESHMSKNKIRKHNYAHILIGKLNYWNMIEPNNQYILESKQMLYKYII